MLVTKLVTKLVMLQCGEARGDGRDAVMSGGDVGDDGDGDGDGDDDGGEARGDDAAMCLFDTTVSRSTLRPLGGVGWGRAGVGKLWRTQIARAHKTCRQSHATLGSRPAPARLF